MYFELHARSAFSFLEGASLPEDLVETCARLDLPGLALLDRDGVYGAPRFHRAAKKAGLRAHVGAEITAKELPQSHRDTEKHKKHNSPLPKSSVPLCLCGQPFRLPLLVESRLGYQNLCRLITRMKLRAEKGAGAATFDDLTAHTAGLICLTGGDDGPLARA
ncbi:MAG: PHP domain-containing protein, partial [Terriglobales bacterium]